MVLFLQSKNRFCYIPENESEQDILGWNKSIAYGIQIRLKTGDTAWSVLLQRFRLLIWNSEHLLGIRRDFYRAYPDINVWVNSFLNIFPPRNYYSQSKGKSNTCVILSILFSIICMMTEIKKIHNLILHTHFLLHLYLILFFVLNIPHTHKFETQNKQS